MSSGNGSSKTDTLVKVVLVFFISLLSFSVGTFVGKQVSDSDHRRMALEGEYKADRQTASTTAPANHDDDSGKITDKEIESLTDEFVNKEKTNNGGEEAQSGEATKGEAAAASNTEGYKSYAREKNSESHTETAMTEKSEKVEKGQKFEKSEKGEKIKASKAERAEKSEIADKVDRTDRADRAEKGQKPMLEAKAESSKVKSRAAVATEKAKAADADIAVAQKVANGDAPTDGKPEERKPASTLPSVASSAVGKYTVQVASFAKEDEAKSKAADLKGKGWNAFYFPAVVSGHTWYRVSVGLFNNAKTANDFRAQFMKDENTKAALVQKIIQ